MKSFLLASWDHLGVSGFLHVSTVLQHRVDRSAAIGGGLRFVVGLNNGHEVWQFSEGVMSTTVKG